MNIVFGVKLLKIILLSLRYLVIYKICLKKCKIEYREMVYLFFIIY
jgi:hypothetical protein